MIHRHDWVARRYAHLNEYKGTVEAAAELPTGIYTQVFFKCSKCGRAKVKEFSGAWESSELKGIKP